MTLEPFVWPAPTCLGETIFAFVGGAISAVVAFGVCAAAVALAVFRPVWMARLRWLAWGCAVAFVATPAMAFTELRACFGDVDVQGHLWLWIVAEALWALAAALFAFTRRQRSEG